MKAIFHALLSSLLHICPALPTLFILLKDFVWIVSLSVYFMDCNCIFVPGPRIIQGLPLNLLASYLCPGHDQNFTHAIAIWLVYENCQGHGKAVGSGVLGQLKPFTFHAVTNIIFLKTYMLHYYTHCCIILIVIQ